MLKNNTSVITVVNGVLIRYIKLGITSKKSKFKHQNLSYRPKTHGIVLWHHLLFCALKNVIILDTWSWFSCKKPLKAILNILHLTSFTATWSERRFWYLSLWKRTLQTSCVSICQDVWLIITCINSAATLPIVILVTESSCVQVIYTQSSTWNWALGPIIPW